jgi:hypothetical protein
VPLVRRTGRRAVSPQVGCSPSLASQPIEIDLLYDALEPPCESLSPASCESFGGGCARWRSRNPAITSCGHAVNGVSHIALSLKLNGSLVAT